MIPVWKPDADQSVIRKLEVESPVPSDIAVAQAITPADIGTIAQSVHEIYFRERERRERGVDVVR